MYGDQFGEFVCGYWGVRSVMEIRQPRLALAICKRRWQNDEYKNKVYIIIWLFVFKMMKEMTECF